MILKEDSEVMPTYTFKNKDTGEEFTDFMSIAALDQYLADNPHIEQMIVSCNIVDPVNIGVKKPPSDFQKYVLGRVKHNMPGATAVANKRWDIPKEI